jgi:zinc/manganese transport system permease protein
MAIVTRTRMRMVEAAIFQGLSWNPATDVRALLSFPFMVNALEAGTIVAVMAGVTGWFMVLRRQTFAGHTLSVIAFTGAAAAGFAGVPVALGYFSVCGLGALALAGFGGSQRSLSVESAATGSLQALALALGFVFVSLYHGVLNGLDSLLFGTFLGITSRQVTVLLAVATLAILFIAAVGRPLFFASVDADVARASGVPVALLGFLFLLVLGLSVAETSQITGALLVFALLVTPAATAHQLTAQPALGITLSVTIAVVVTWLGLALAYFSIYPVGFYVTSLSFALYVFVRVGRSLANRRRRNILVPEPA